MTAHSFVLAAAIRSKRGQTLLRDLLAALDAMPDKKLIAGDFVRPNGSCCALGVLGLARGIDPEYLAALGDDYDRASKSFGASISLIRHIQDENDHRLKNATQDQRWAHVRGWAASKIDNLIEGSTP